VQVGDEIGLRGIDHLRRCVGEDSEFTQGGGERGLLLDENVQCAGDRAQRPRQHLTLGAERPGEAIERTHRLDQIVALAIEGARKPVQPPQEVPQLWFVSGQRGIHVVDDVADLAKTTGVDQCRH
jgi:hypothetical protein